MQIPLSIVSSYRRPDAILTAALGLSLMAGSASAETAYIDQTSNGASRTAGGFTPVSGSGPVTYVPTPELVAPLSRNSNFAESVAVGNANTIAQVQAGRGDLSAVTVLGGSHDHVGVIQGGDDERSNVVLLGIQGLNLTVLQPTNAPPVNMLIARLPNGGFLIKK
ncbi:hypothetical protein [Beijerinckia sp. L45]|uniref:hypothetical protein n=1 Tax=Beijerinckia sp. L45 TaxID=1641855 RepID=UPI00131B9539|nr:hypothetical protein [Beijerinckia sp. L45]